MMITGTYAKYKQKQLEHVIRYINKMEKKQSYYGIYDTIEEVRKIRDKLEKNEWKKIPTRKYEKNKNKTPRHIHKDKYNKYVLTKSIDGYPQYFGAFKTRSEAVEERDYLITHNWNYDDV